MAVTPSTSINKGCLGWKGIVNDGHRTKTGCASEDIVPMVIIAIRVDQVRRIYIFLINRRGCGDNMNALNTADPLVGAVKEDNMKRLLVIVFLALLSGCADMTVGGAIGCGLGYALTGNGAGCARGGAAGASLGALNAYSRRVYDYDYGYYYPEQQYYQQPEEKPCEVYWSGTWQDGQWVRTGQYSCQQSIDAPPPMPPMPPPQ